MSAVAKGESPGPEVMSRMAAGLGWSGDVVCAGLAGRMVALVVLPIEDELRAFAAAGSRSRAPVRVEGLLAVRRRWESASQAAGCTAGVVPGVVVLPVEEALRCRGRAESLGIGVMTWDRQLLLSPSPRRSAPRVEDYVADVAFEVWRVHAGSGLALVPRP